LLLSTIHAAREQSVCSYHVILCQVIDAYDLGVLTKPDRIPTGEEGSWIRRIQGYHDEEEGGIKYFSVKNPDSQDINSGITYEQARQREVDFFATQDPWASLDWVYKQRLGTEKLTQHLGQALSDLISKRQVFVTLNLDNQLERFDRLPELEEELTKLLERTTHELSRLPNPPSSEPVGEMMRILNTFIRSIERLVDGVPDEDGLIQALREPQTEFKKAIRKTAPDFRPLTSSEMPETPSPPRFLVDEDTEWQDQPIDDSGAIYIDEVMRKAYA
jgi:hypothetical protein